MKSIIFSIVISLCVGYFVGVNQSSNKPTRDTSKAAKSNVNNELTDLAFDFKEYVRLKNSEEKYKKADELLGKVMLLYLANIAAHVVDGPTKAYFNKPIDERLPKLPIREEKLKIEKPSSKQVSEKDSSKKEIETYLNPVEMDEVDRELKKKQLKKPNITKALSTIITNRKVYGIISGVYSGSIRYEVGKFKGEVHRVELETDYKEEDAQLVGTYFLAMSKDGEYYSRSRGNGGNANIKLSEKKEFILNASPTSFIQIIPISSNYLIGNYYENNQYFGTVRLEKSY